MPNIAPYLSALLLITLPLFVQADDDLAVDQADSLDFDNFHISKQSDVKLYDSKKGTFIGQNAPSQSEINPQSDSHKTKKDLATTPSSASKKILNDNTDTSIAPDQFKIRQRYSLSKNSASTPTQATNQLYTTMAKQCPNGWNKHKEWSVAVDNDFYLYYQFSCRP